MTEAAPVAGRLAPHAGSPIGAMTPARGATTLGEESTAVLSEALDVS